MQITLTAGAILVGDQCTGASHWPPASSWPAAWHSAQSLQATVVSQGSESNYESIIIDNPATRCFDVMPTGIPNVNCNSFFFFLCKGMPFI